jgi:hypothetical protein
MELDLCTQKIILANILVYNFAIFILKNGKMFYLLKQRRKIFLHHYH